MKILTIVQTAVATDSQWDERLGVMQAIHHEASPGHFVHVTLGGAGLAILHGDAAVAIPLAELLRIAALHEPSLGPAKK
jgi:hypothetical protein